MTGKLSAKVKRALQYDTHAIEGYKRGHAAGVRTERKRFKAERERWLRLIASLQSQLEPFRGVHGSPLNPDQVARREMWRAESNFQQRIK